MNDIEKASQILEEENYSLVVVKGGKVIFTSEDKGIKPMYYLSKNMKDEVKGGSIADKVIGRGAALLSIYLDIKQVYGKVMSKEAVEVLEGGNIAYGFETLCDRIQNRDKSGLCPVEKLSLNIVDPTILLKELEDFLQQ